MVLLAIIIALPLLFSFIDILFYLINGKRGLNIYLIRFIETLSFLVLPALYLCISGTKNDCCDESAAFSPQHQLTIYVFILLCVSAYFYSSYRSKIAAPVVELIVNCLLILGIILNVFIAFHTQALWLFGGLGNLPIIFLSIMVLVKNQNLFRIEMDKYKPGNTETIQAYAWNILNLHPLQKIPALVILCLPITVLLSAILMLFGQKPDSIIRAFTETYKHGFSTWDYKCDNVDCGGHFLCSVAAKGHLRMVKPIRLGYRNGNTILCNRQLLVSNAFEDLVKENFPFLHKHIRSQYNKVGNFIHRYYYIFENKYLADFIYIIMKPLEWLFLLIIYSFDRNPENRIAKQYLKKKDRIQIENSFFESLKVK